MASSDGSITRSRNVMLVLVVVTLIFCLTYSNITRNISFKRINERRHLPQHGGHCPIPWRNERINLTEYESSKFNDSKMNSNEDFSTSKSVKPIYPDPVIKLRPDYFILPMLHNGPNNQLIGFRETIFVAIKLNRSVVIPKFFKHHTDDDNLSRISPEHRLQVSDICKLVSCITFQNFREACRYQLDAIFHIRRYDVKSRQRMERYTGMKMRRISHPEKGKPDVVLIPPDPIPNNGGSRHFHGPDVTKLFTATEKCVIYPYPLYNVHLPPLKKEKYERGSPLVETQEDLETLSDTRVSLSISHHTKSPEYIQNLAEEFVGMVMKANYYISVHWRYQPDEFMQRCNHGTTANPVKKKICQNALNITPQDIADSIERKIFSLKMAEGEQFNIKYIYFATPSSERNILSEVARTLHKRNRWLTYSYLDLVKYLDDKFNSCPTLQRHYNDILSTTEMELCAFAVAFLGSQRSSWSDAVHISRKTSNYDHVSALRDGDIFMLSLGALQRRTVDEES